MVMATVMAMAMVMLKKINKQKNLNLRVEIFCLVNFNLGESLVELKSLALR